MSSLVLIARATGQEWKAAGDRVQVGRETGADLLVPDGSVSRRHALLERLPTGWMLRDQDSANGTFVDGRRVTATLLLDGQVVRFGAVEFEVLLPEEAQVRTGMMTVPPDLREPARAPTTAVRPTAGTVRLQPEEVVQAGAARPLPSREEAAARLEVRPDAAWAEIEAQYRRLVEDLQARQQTAPTAILRRAYERHLEELRQAYEALAPR